MNSPSPGPRRVHPPVYFLASFVVMGALDRFLPGVRWIGYPVDLGGVLLMAAGVGLIFLCVGLFRRAGTPLRPLETSTALVVTGPYRFSRNPIYLGLAIAVLGWAWVLGSITPFLVVPLFVLLLDRRFVRAEEALLARTFGAAYDEYRSRVRRWL